MRFSAEQKIVGGFSLALSFMVAIGVASHRSLTRLMEDAARIEAAQEVLTHLESLRAVMTEVEAANRGFALTGDEGFLDSYTSAIQRGDADFRWLWAQAASYPGLQRLLDALAPLRAERMEFSREVIELRRTLGFDAAQGKITVRQAQQLHDPVSAAIAEMVPIENGLLQERTASLFTTARQAQAVIIGGSMLAFLSVGLALVLILRDFSLRRQAEDSLQRLNEELETRVEQRTAELAKERATLRDSELHLRTILDAEPECVKLLDREGNLLDMNQAGLAMIEADSIDERQGRLALGRRGRGISASVPNPPRACVSGRIE